MTMFAILSKNSRFAESKIPAHKSFGNNSTSLTNNTQPAVDNFIDQKKITDHTSGPADDTSAPKVS